MKIYDKEHPHHYVWREYTESVLAGKPKKVQRKNCNGMWVELKADTITGEINSHWIEESDYRIATELKKLVVNGREFHFPMPFRGELAHGQDYYLATIDGSRCVRCNRTHSKAKEHIDTGLVHLTHDAAVEHSKVLQEINQL